MHVMATYYFFATLVARIDPQSLDFVPLGVCLEGNKKPLHQRRVHHLCDGSFP